MRKPNKPSKKPLRVFFIGASHTQVWKIPKIVETLAASAPPECPRIITDGYLRGGTMIDKFWKMGTGPDTPRGMIADGSWDFVVIETFYYIKHDGLFKYGTLFADLIRKSGAKPVLYESPTKFKSPYPQSFQNWHDENVAFGKKLKVNVAPSCLAWMLYLGPNPTPEQRRALYRPDDVHTSEIGGYMVACCIYSAITGLSPVGLTHKIPTLGDEGITKKEAEVLQEAAWKAYQKTVAEMKKKE